MATDRRGWQPLTEMKAPLPTIAEADAMFLEQTDEEIVTEFKARAACEEQPT